MTTIIKLRRDTAANWTSSNPILAAGEPGLETDTLKIKYGDGSNTWANLSYQSVGNATFATSATTANVALSVEVSNVANIGNIATINLDGNVGNVLAGNGTWIAAGGEVTGNINVSATNSQINFVANSSGDGAGYSTIQLIPDTTATSDQYIIIDPTAPSHIHIRAGGTQDNSTADLILGGEQNHVMVRDNTGVYLTNIEINPNYYNFSDPADFTSASWYESNGAYYITFTTSNPTLQQVALDFNNNAQDTVEVTDGAEFFTLTPSGSYGNPGGGVLVLGVTEAPAGNVTVNLTGLNFTIYVTRNNEARLTDNDFTVNVTDDVRITGNDIVSLRNYSTTEPITIIANYDNQNKIWEFRPDGSTIYPTLTVTRGDRTGTLTGQTLLFGDSTQGVIISTPDGTVNDNSSQRIVINPGAGAANTSGEGGDIYLYAGRGGSGDIANAVSGGSGGDIKIRGGLGLEGGAGGYLDIQGGEADGNGEGGRIDIRGGYAGNTVGGNINIDGGQGQVGGGVVNINGGYTSTGAGGVVNITGGVSGNGLNEYGNVNIASGVSNWVFDNTGNLTLPGNIVAINFANSSPAFGNIVSVNLDGNVSNVLLGNGIFATVPVNANTLLWTTAPTANTDPGTAGQIAYDVGGNLYVCVTTNTWSKFSGTTSW